MFIQNFVVQLFKGVELIELRIPAEVLLISNLQKKKISLETLKVYIQIKALAKYSNLLK